ncbi:hypothetical protein QVD17_10930 [Tagetes erecta]|uniref:Uncharacterized protein n=1 Tax=Tagetes erecta TaxID=13708 RepID=A0AAD8P6M9_TARER|nr:hypothetical protein QVD17_10930 [Tagetes erecta]
MKKSFLQLYFFCSHFGPFYERSLVVADDEGGCAHVDRSGCGLDAPKFAGKFHNHHRAGKFHNHHRTDLQPFLFSVLITGTLPEYLSGTYLFLFTTSVTGPSRFLFSPAVRSSLELHQKHTQNLVSLFHFNSIQSFVVCFLRKYYSHAQCLALIYLSIHHLLMLCFNFRNPNSFIQYHHEM